jgi:hypothetical protein
MRIAMVLGGLISRLGTIPRALRPDPEQTFVASDRMARIDVVPTLRDRDRPWTSQLGAGSGPSAPDLCTV